MGSGFCESLATIEETNERISPKLVDSNMITISDDNTPFALTYMTYDPHSYNAQLESKVQHALSLLADESIPVLSIPHEIFESPAKNYRHRCRFGVNVDEEGVWYAMWEHGEANVRLISFPLASIYISTCMPILLDYLKHDDVLRNHIKAVNFLSTTTGDLSITLIYEGSFSADWTNHAQVLFDSLRLHNSILNPETNLVGIIGRGKGVKSVVGDENVRECFQLNSGRILQYTQVPDGFSNPNPEVNRKCLNWLCDVISTIPALSKGNTGCSNCAGCIGDTGATCCEEVEHLGLLELYCGNGNHTVALAGIRLMISQSNDSFHKCSYLFIHSCHSCFTTRYDIYSNEMCGYI